MSRYGSCGVCGAKVKARFYKIKGQAAKRVLYRCERTIAHSYSDAQLAELEIDIEYYKRALGQ